jgi:hypothetical protein
MRTAGCSRTPRPNPADIMVGIPPRIPATDDLRIHGEIRD